MMKQGNCERCNTLLPKQERGYPRKYCVECKKAVRVEDTQRYNTRQDDKALRSINPIYLSRKHLKNISVVTG